MSDERVGEDWSLQDNGSQSSVWSADLGLIVMPVDDDGCSQDFFIPVTAKLPRTH